MAITSSELLQNILFSINSALQQESLENDIRASLIDQYERTTVLIRDGYQFSEVDLQNLPTTVRTETIALVNEVIATFENTSSTLTNSFNTQLSLLESHNLTIQESNSILSTVTNKSQEINTSLALFSSYLTVLAGDKVDIQATKNDILLIQNHIDGINDGIDSVIADAVNSQLGEFTDKINKNSTRRKMSEFGLKLL